MTENENITAQPEAEEKETDIPAATTQQEENEVLIPIKFNKEVKELTVLEAAELAQKGMKFDLIFKDYEVLKGLAEKNGKSVSGYLEELKSSGLEQRKQEIALKCGGDEELAEYIVGLEQSKSGEDRLKLSEVCSAFPTIKSIDDLPQEVVERASLKGTLLLDELLRYKLEQKRNLQQAIKCEEKARLSSSGPQKNRNAPLDPETEEFIKAIWK